MKERPILFKTDMVKAILNCKPNIWPPEPINPSKSWKWQTRRVMKPQPQGRIIAKGYWQNEDTGEWEWQYQSPTKIEPGFVWNELFTFGNGNCPYGQSADTLWVKETWRTVNSFDHLPPANIVPGEVSYPAVWYKTPYSSGNGNDEYIQRYCGKWRSSLFMPRWASRQDLLIKAVRVERLHDITEESIEAEGTPHNIACYQDFRDKGDPILRREQFKVLWGSIHNKPKPLKCNPFTFEKEDCYVSYPWDGEQEKRLRFGKHWYVIPNPWLWVIEFMRMG